MIKHVYIIAEAGVNHNGRLDLALQLCDAAKEAGVDAIKFQTWKTELIISKNTEMADYQKNNLDNDDSQYDMLKKLELSYDNFRLIKDYCDNIGIQFLSTADERLSAFPISFNKSILYFSDNASPNALIFSTVKLFPRGIIGLVILA